MSLKLLPRTFGKVMILIKKEQPMDSEIEKKLDGINDLPSLPIIAGRVKSLLESNETDIKTISKVIMHDPALAVKTVRLANSAYYGLSTPVTSIDHAVVLIGLNAVYNIILGLSIMKTFRIPKTRWFDPDQFWRHCIGCAFLSRKLAIAIGFSHPGTCFTAGLSHDIGRLILAQFLPEGFSGACSLARENNCPLRKAETEIIGFDHAATGAWLARKWGLPDTITAVIEFHHDIIHAPPDSELVKIVAAANSICLELDIGDSGENEIEVSSQDLVPQEYGIDVRKFAECAQAEIFRTIRQWAEV
jgi:putative nucleotidyltransferase with HDIG domain